MGIRCDVWGQNLVWLSTKVSLYLVVFILFSVWACWLVHGLLLNKMLPGAQHVPGLPSTRSWIIAGWADPVVAWSCSWEDTWGNKVCVCSQARQLAAWQTQGPLRRTGLGGAVNAWVWEYCILQLWSEARAELGCPGLWWVVLLTGGHKADTTALLLHLPGHKLCDVILLPVGLKYRGIWELALRAACVCWRWKKHVLIRLRSWEVTRFIKLRGAPISGNTSVLRLWWGTSQVTKHCTSRNAEACSREVHKPQPGGSLVGLPPSPPFPCLFPISSNLSLHFGCPSPSELCATTTPSTCSPGFASSSKPLQLKVSLKALAMQLY